MWVFISTRKPSIFFQLGVAACIIMQCRRNILTELASHINATKPSSTLLLPCGDTARKILQHYEIRSYSIIIMLKPVQSHFQYRSTVTINY